MAAKLDQVEIQCVFYNFFLNICELKKSLNRIPMIERPGMRTESK